MDAYLILSLLSPRSPCIYTSLLASVIYQSLQEEVRIVLSKAVYRIFVTVSIVSHCSLSIWRREGMRP